MVLTDVKRGAMKLTALDGTFAVCRLSPDASIPQWIDPTHFWVVAKTHEEVSIVCEQSSVPKTVRSETGWKILQVEGPLDFGLTGILASIVQPLAHAKISIFAISTFDTDYVLVQSDQRERAQQALQQAGFTF